MNVTLGLIFSELQTIQKGIVARQRKGAIGRVGSEWYMFKIRLKNLNPGREGLTSITLPSGGVADSGRIAGSGMNTGVVEAVADGVDCLLVERGRGDAAIRNAAFGA